MIKEQFLEEHTECYWDAEMFKRKHDFHKMTYEKKFFQEIKLLLSFSKVFFLVKV